MTWASRNTSMAGNISVMVVGAGVSGLQTARALLKAGMQVTVLEMGVDVGGVWYKNYPGFGLQVPWYLYQFPEFPMPDELKLEHYSAGETVQEYIRAYTKHFDLYPHIKLRCKLVRLQRSRGSGWNVFYCDGNQNNLVCQMEADYVAVCTGIYATPYIPTYEGMDGFKGMHCHAQFLQDRELARGKHVLVVGAGKTALDCAAEVAASEVAKSVTMLYRQPHWPIPRRLSQSVHMEHITHSRLPAMMLPPYYTARPLQRLGRALMRPLQWAYWRCLESKIKKIFSMQGQRVPPMGLDQDLFYGGHILDSSWHALLQSGRVQPVRDDIKAFTEQGVRLLSGGELNAEVVIFCTGFRKVYDYLEKGDRNALRVQQDGLYLYRHILPPGVPGLFFIGCEVNTYNNILSHYLQAEWVARVLQGKLQLPSVPEMQADIDQQQAWCRRVMPNQRYRGSVVALYMTDYHRQLLADMGIPGPRPTPRPSSLLSCLQPHRADDYHLAVVQQRQQESAEKPGGTSLERRSAARARRSLDKVTALGKGLLLKSAIRSKSFKQVISAGNNDEDLEVEAVDIQVEGASRADSIAAVRHTAADADVE